MTDKIDNNEIPSIEKRKKFAQEQLQFLKDKGITNSRRLSRIFKAAGPGQVQAAWELSNQPEGQLETDVLDCILTGVRGSQDFGRERMEAVLAFTGFTVPEANSSRSFFRILDGAIEILVPDSYEFDERELTEIEEGLQRSKEKREKYQSEDQ